ncbi:hypothetical protein Bca4012_038852 [Brassica carinata]
MNQFLVKSIQLSDLVVKAADEASLFKQECTELKAKTEKLADFFTRAKQVKRIEISDQHRLATQRKDLYGL